MKTPDRSAHWEHIYRTRPTDQCSWYQDRPDTALGLIHSLALSREGKVIDIGGGDSRLVDFLLQEGFRNLSVLDISGEALELARGRLGPQAAQVAWIPMDVLAFNPTESYNLWHDRAAFHFLTDAEEVRLYLMTLSRALAPGGYAILGTFSDQGPEKCSGLPIHRYSETELTALLKPEFDKIQCLREDHRTPSGALQNFLYCTFRKR